VLKAQDSKKGVTPVNNILIFVINVTIKEDEGCPICDIYYYSTTHNIYTIGTN
jgi:hypothetical protein